MFVEKTFVRLCIGLADRQGSRAKQAGGRLPPAYSATEIRANGAPP